MQPTAPDRCRIGLPAFLPVTVMVLSIPPAIVNLLGIDFGAPRGPLDAGALSPKSPQARLDAVAHSRECSCIPTILEWSAFCMAFFTLIPAFRHYSLKAEITALIIGLARFFAGVRDALHLVNQSGGPITVASAV